MNKPLLAAFLLAAAVSTAAAQTFTAPVDRKPRERVQRRPPAPVYPRPAVGAIPRAARGNPLQMINPMAPRKYYGPPDDTVTYDQDNPSRITGIILFGLRW
jgi:hypothetical protein